MSRFYLTTADSTRALSLNRECDDQSVITILPAGIKEHDLLGIENKVYSKIVFRMSRIFGKLNFIVQ